ncbi:MAG: hypothetical protein INH37_06370, partial [Myxococcaceae bacterium]|nr:hypothetical protein [Myxococcaceae bacterium]
MAAPHGGRASSLGERREGARFDSSGEFGDTAGVAFLRRLVAPLTRLVKGPATRDEGLGQGGEPPAPRVIDTFELATPKAARVEPAPTRLTAAFRADSFAGFVDGFEPAARAPVDLRGDRAPIVPEVFEVERPAPVVASSGFSASLDDLVGADEWLDGSAEAPGSPGPDEAFHARLDDAALEAAAQLVADGLSVTEASEARAVDREAGGPAPGGASDASPAHAQSPDTGAGAESTRSPSSHEARPASLQTQAPSLPAATLTSAAAGPTPSNASPAFDGPALPPGARSDGSGGALGPASDGAAARATSPTLIPSVVAA